MKDSTNTDYSRISESNALSVVEGKHFFVYILRSSSNQFYIGQTNNLHNREKQQLSKSSKAAKFIKDGDNFQLVLTGTPYNRQ